MSGRITAVTPLSDALLFWSLSGREKLSEPFNFEVELLSEQPRLDEMALLGESITIVIPLPQLTSQRYLNGKITGVNISSQELSGERYTVYRLRMESDLWPLMHDRNQRVFQHKSVPEIIKTLLSENNVVVEDKLIGNYSPWEYCVQYQESSLNFISRLMELEGIYYYFEHEAGQHKLVLLDDNANHQPFPGYETINYHLTPSGGTTSEEGISQWSLHRGVTPGLYSVNDYDFRKPYAVLLQTRQNPVSPQPGYIDVYDWPGHYVESAQGEQYSRIRQQLWQSSHQTLSGTATALGVASGHTFKLLKAPQSGDNKEYLVTSTLYALRDNRYASGDAQQTQHSIQFTVIPADVQYRPPVTTRWPRTYGPQTAKVVCPAGESIWTDKYGRVKVQFHWDREAKGDDTSSCWVRVASTWAGQGFGGIQIPRLNDEVVIDFINGDPDRPIITGRVYNEANMPPWSLPAGATQMGFMSRSKGGSADTANALRFEDKMGEEQVMLEAQKNMDINVKNDETHTIGANRTKTITGDEIVSVKSNRTETVDSNETITIHGSRTETVDGDETVTLNSSRTSTIKVDSTSSIGGNDEQTITGNRKVTISGNLTNGVTGDLTSNVTGNETRTVNGNHDNNVTGTKIETIGDNVTLTYQKNVVQSVSVNKTTTIGGDEQETITGSQITAITANQGVTVDGNQTFTVIGSQTHDVTGDVTIVSAKKISLLCGASSLILDESGNISINGVNITSTASKAHNINGTNIASTATGDNVVEGALLKLNP